MNRDTPMLATVLSPTSCEAFMADCWEQAPLHVSRQEPDRFRAWLSSQGIVDWLSTAEIYYPDSQLIANGKPIAVEQYTEDNDIIKPVELLALHEQGATLVMSQMQRCFPALSQLCREVGFSLGMRCQANLYLSPPAAQGFNPHYDTHDVLIIQIEGRKTFRLYSDGVDWPLNNTRFDPAGFEPGECIEELTLEAGDTLYIPRGLTHAASTCADSHSLHVTLGLYTVTQLDLLQSALQQLAIQRPSLRQSVAADLLRGEHGADAVVSLQAMLRQCAEHCDGDVLENALSALLDHQTQRLNPRGYLPKYLQSNKTESNADESVGQTELLVDVSLPIRRQWLPAQQQAPATLKVRIPGAVLTFTGDTASVVDDLLQAGRCLVAQLPEQTPSARKAWIDTLSQHGVLTIRVAS